MQGHFLKWVELSPFERQGNKESGGINSLWQSRGHNTIFRTVGLVKSGPATALSVVVVFPLIIVLPVLSTTTSAIHLASANCHDHFKALCYPCELQQSYAMETIPIIQGKKN